MTALKTFWRDVQKYYYLPIIMSDMRDRETNERNVGTSTLTIEIGDTNNHEHKPGHKEIFVYKYDFKGTLILYMPRILNEPQHEISNNVVCAISKALDQPAICPV